MKIHPDNNLISEGKKYLNNFDTNKKLIFSKKDLVSVVSKWSIRLSPYDVPENLETVLDEFQDHIDIYFQNLKKEDFGYIEMTLSQLINFLKGNLITIKEFKDWNLSKIEKRLNIKFNDNRGEYCNQIIDKYHEIDINYDFVDLDALIRNVSHDIYKLNLEIK